MFLCDPTTRAELDASPNKLADAAVIQAALGNTRRIRCKRDPNASATDPWETGEEFRNVGSTGTLKVVGGRIVSLGRIKGATISLPADMSTGRSVVRIEGNGRWIQGTLGMVGSNPAPDFATRGNFTATNGFAVAANFAISGKRLKPSGTGPVAPELTANSPATLELWDWRNVNAPVLVGTLAFNNRTDDLVMQDADVASEIGDVRITQSTQSIVFGEYEFGALYFSANPAINSEANVPLDQVLVGCKPYGRWASYPYEDTWNGAVDGTFPWPFKMVMKRANGTVLHTFEMYSTRTNDQDGTGYPINDPRFGQGNEGPPLGLHPGFNCAQLLTWQSHIPTMSTKAHKFCNGVTTESRRPSMFKQGVSNPGSMPLAWHRWQGNSMNHWYALPRWPLGATSENSPLPAEWVDPENTTAPDPYLFNYDYHAYEGRVSRITGWDYEPGAVGGHDWLNALGGPRSDRAAIPLPMMLYLSDKDGVRLKGNIPLKKMNNAWGMNYFNLSHYYVTDVKTFATMPDENGFKALHAYGMAYYGYRQDYAPGGLKNQVMQRSIAQAGDWPYLDKDGRHHYNGFAVDDQHAYANPGLQTMLFNSPMHVYAAKCRYHAVLMSALGAISLDSPGRPWMFLFRAYAWRMLNQVITWKVATTHPLGLNRESIEARLQTEIESVYTHMYKPAIIDENPHPDYQGYKRFGMQATEVAYTVENPPGVYTNYHYMGAAHDSKAYYMAHTLVLMKQTGLWAVMRARSARCAQMMDFIIECLDKFCIDRLYHTYGRTETTYIPAKLASEPLGEMPLDWADWAVKYPRNGLESMVHNPDGSWRDDMVGEDATACLPWQYVFARRDYFPEKPHPHLAAVCTMVQGWIDERTAMVNAKTTPQDKMGADWTYWFASHGVLNPPTELGPA